MDAIIANESESAQRLKVLTWNINGDQIDNGTAMRLQAILIDIESSGGDVIFLQEATMNFKSMLQLRLGCAYEFEDFSAETTEPFFVMIMLRKSRIKKLMMERIDFQDGGRSNMGRYILRIEALVLGANANVNLMTAHLESCKENSVTRMFQYEQLLRLIVSAPVSSVQLCGGDFNLRESEDKSVRKRLKESGVNIDIAVDAFEAAGRPFEANSTWRRKMDKAPSARNMQARFDRQIFRSGTTDFSLLRDSFCLLGVEDVAGVDEATSCSAGFTTPSDHMGILCEYVLGDRDLIRSAAEADGSLKQAAQAAGINSPVVCVLIGAPGSGKSSLAAHLSPSFVRISQDALGNRHKCEDAALAALQSGSSVVIDRCNFDANQRSTWLSLARRCSARAVAVQLHAPLDVCLQRVAARRCHEGGLDGESKNMVDVVTTLHGSHKWVTDDEGFCDVHVFQHPATSKNIAMELLKAHSMQGTNRNPVFNAAARNSPALLHRISSSAQPIGVQSDSSSESSQERDILAPSSSRVIPPPPAPLHPVTQHTTSAVCASENQADANSDDCVLIEHVPSRSKRPLPGALAAVPPPTVKVKNDPYVAATQDCSIVDAPPAKKSRGRPAKTPVVASAPRAPNPTRQATVPSPPPPAEIAPFQFTAETLLKAATLYLATHPFLEPHTTCPATDELPSQQAPQAALHSSQTSSSFSHSQFTSQVCSYSQFTSQAHGEELLDQSQRCISTASVASSMNDRTPKSQRFDLESAFLDASSLPSVSALQSSYSTRNDRAQIKILEQTPLSSERPGSSNAFHDCSDITSADFEINFMSSLLPQPRAPRGTPVPATSLAPAAARNSSAGTGARWNSQFTGASLKEIADMLCTSTRRV